MLHEFRERFGEVDAERPRQFVAFDRENLGSIVRLPAHGARERARGARHDHRRDVGDDERHLARGAHAERAAARGRRLRRVHRLGEVPLAAVPRRADEHHAARRRLFRSCAWACRWSAPTARRASSARALASASGGTPTGGYYQWSVLLRAMSAFENYRKVYRDAVHAGARRRAAGAERGRSALAAPLRGRGVREPARGGQSPVARDRAPRRRTACRAALRPRRVAGGGPAARLPATTASTGCATSTARISRTSSSPWRPSHEAADPATRPPTATAPASTASSC